MPDASPKIVHRPNTLARKIDAVVSRLIHTTLSLLMLLSRSVSMSSGTHTWGILPVSRAGLANETATVESAFKHATF